MTPNQKPGNNDQDPQYVKDARYAAVISKIAELDEDQLRQLMLDIDAELGTRFQSQVDSKPEGKNHEYPEIEFREDSLRTEEE